MKGWVGTVKGRARKSVCCLGISVRVLEIRLACETKSYTCIYIVGLWRARLGGTCLEAMSIIV